MKNNDIKKYYFSEIVAKEVGVEEAMMFSNIFFWVKHNEKIRSERHLHNEKYWMFNSITSFVKQYPFWTPAKIRRILKNLIEKNYIETGVFNKHGYDKTKWYTITEKGLNTANSDEGYVETINSFEEN